MKIYKKLILILFLLTLVVLPSYAEKIPIKIAPAQVISTHHDEIEIGDWVKFEIAKDVYFEDNLYIKKNTQVIGIVDFFHQNGWGGDCAEIYFKKFYTRDINNKKVEIDYPLEISGNAEMQNSTRDVISNGGIRAVSFFHFPYLTYAGRNYAGFILRGAEIDIEPDTRVFNLFIER